ncbi:MAG: NAD(P)-dependent oxidoreductase [Pseudomonadota bacterium]
MTHQTRTAVIGLGAMGAGMAANLQRAGHLTGAWNRTASRGEQAAQQYGFVLSPSLAAAVRHAELVVVSVSDDDAMLAIVAQLGPLLTTDTVVLDTSTVSPTTARQAADSLASYSCHFLDAPVSGGREGAAQGSLVMMIGGDASQITRVEPALHTICSRILPMGPIGSGQMAKAVNQVMVAGINQAVTEALAFAQDAGLDQDQVLDAVSGGAAGNWFVQHRGQSMYQEQFAPGFRVALHAKDLRICQQLLAERHIRLPMVEMTLVHYQRLIEAGYGDEDISALFRLKQQLFTSDKPTTA